MLKLLLIPQRYKFSSKSQPLPDTPTLFACCCWYHKGTNFQANHNANSVGNYCLVVVADTTKVQIFKQITTATCQHKFLCVLLLIPQRYKFSSKSQPVKKPRYMSMGCCWYHKGTNFQANHNWVQWYLSWVIVVADTTKVQIFKQITTYVGNLC